MYIKKGDNVVVISGKDKGKKGKVLEVDTKSERIIVENVNMVTKHKKPTQQMQQGGIINQEGSIHSSNVMLFDKKAGKGVRVGFEIRDGKKVRISKKTGEVL